MTIAQRFLVSAGWVALTLLRASGGHAQTPAGAGSPRAPETGHLVDGMPLYVTPPGTAEGVLEEMADRAAVIFAGTVTAVRKPTENDLQSNVAGSVVEVQFTVERAVLGPPAGSVYVMREWAGLWRDSPRFTPGQRLLILLHAPGPAGLSSPVDGLDGAIPIHGGATLDGSLGLASAASLTNAVAADPAAESTVDLRWLQAKALHSVGFSDAPIASPGVQPVGAPGTGGSPGTMVTTTGQGTAATGSSAPAALARVLTLLTMQMSGNASH